MDDSFRIPRIDLIDFCKSYITTFQEHFSLEFDKVSFTSGNISFFEMVALTTIIAQFKPALILEFGTFNGRTTLNMALNSYTCIYTVDLPKNEITKFPLADGKHDPNDELGFIGLTEKLFNNYPQRPQPFFPIADIRQLWMDTAVFGQQPLANKFDFMFIDASHSFENCQNDTINAFKLVRQGGIIAWHDYNGWPGVTEALNRAFYIYTNTKFYWIHDTSIVIAMNNEKEV